jgi:SRSO17 transposase
LSGRSLPFGKLRTGLAHVGPRGRALVDPPQADLYLPEGWTSDPDRCAAAGVPEAQREYRAKTDLALEMPQEAQARGHLTAQWVTGDDAFGMSPDFRDGLAAQGMQYVLEVPPNTPVWPLEPTWSSPAYQGRGRPRPSPATARGAPDHD